MEAHTHSSTHTYVPRGRIVYVCVCVCVCVCVPSLLPTSGADVGGAVVFAGAPVGPQVDLA